MRNDENFLEARQIFNFFERNNVLTFIKDNFNKIRLDSFIYELLQITRIKMLFQNKEYCIVDYLIY